MSKGSAQRPTNKTKFNEGWEKAFRKRNAESYEIERKQKAMMTPITTK